MKKKLSLIVVLVLLIACVPLSLLITEITTLCTVDDGSIADFKNVGSGASAVAADTFMYGDVDSSSRINVRDLGLLQQHLNGWDVTLNTAAADVTGDGRLNVRDLGLLQQYLNGWDVKFPDPPSTESTTPPTESTTPPTESTTPSTEPTTPSTEPTTSTTEPSQPTEPSTYTVTFKDYDGTVLKTVTVYAGESAAAPADPVRVGFAFAGWDTDFSNVTEDLVIKATYTANPVITDATISVESVTVNKGANEVQVNVRVINNPGIMTATLSVDVDDEVFGFKSASKSGYDNLFLTSPGNKQINSPYRFLLDGMELTEDDKVDGVLFTITFTIKDTSVTGNYAVDLSYVKGDITNENYEWLDIAVQDGTITIQ